MKEKDRPEMGKEEEDWLDLEEATWRRRLAGILRI
jgi:hypothetical protein